MELKEFIKQSLTQISQGVKESQDELKEYDAIIAPGKTLKNGEYYYVRNDSHGNQQVTEIKFKVGLTINESSGSKGGIGVISGIFNLGGKLESDNSNQSVNTIEFTVPIVLPPGNVG